MPERHTRGRPSRWRSAVDVRCSTARTVGRLVVGHRLRRALRLDALAVVLDLVVDGVGVPTEDRRDDLGGRARGADGAVPGLDGQPGAPGQDVVEVEGALVRRG